MSRYTAPVPTPKAASEIAWSHSALNAYKDCPHRYYRERVAKDYKPDFNSPALRKGNEVHKALEDYIAVGKPITDPDKQRYIPWADSAMQQLEAGDMEKHVEIEMCFDNKYGQTSWFGKQAWFRCKADLLGVNRRKGIALNLDWKTNKRYYGEKGQAELNAAATFLLFPEVDTVGTLFAYMEIDKKVAKTFHRSQLPSLLTPSLTTLQDIARSYQQASWPKQASGLCKSCTVEDCENHPKQGG